MQVGWQLANTWKDASWMGKDGSTQTVHVPG